jgi:hypothetical protein
LPISAWAAPSEQGESVGIKGGDSLTFVRCVAPSIGRVLICPAILKTNQILCGLNIATDEDPSSVFIAFEMKEPTGHHTLIATKNTKSHGYNLFLHD